jgi:hypothetical protein
MLGSLVRLACVGQEEKETTSRGLDQRLYTRSRQSQQHGRPMRRSRRMDRCAGLKPLPNGFRNMPTGNFVTQSRRQRKDFGPSRVAIQSMREKSKISSWNWRHGPESRPPSAHLLGGNHRSATRKPTFDWKSQKQSEREHIISTNPDTRARRSWLQAVVWKAYPRRDPIETSRPSDA